jgi:hypothetical protein
MTERDVDDLRIENGTVRFGDGTTTQFACVEFLPDGRLKTVQRTAVPADPRYFVDRVTYHAAGTWAAVQPPQPGALLAHYGTDPHAIVIASGITKDTVRQHVTEWCSNRTRGVVVPAPAGVDPDKLLDTEFNVCHRTSGETMKTLRFEWFQPPLDPQSQTSKFQFI